MVACMDPDLLIALKALSDASRLRIVGGGSHDGDVHAALLVDLLVRNLREDQLIVQTERVVAAPVKRLGRNTFVPLGCALFGFAVP